MNEPRDRRWEREQGNIERETDRHAEGMTAHLCMSFRCAPVLHSLALCRTLYKVQRTTMPRHSAESRLQQTSWAALHIQGTRSARCMLCTLALFMVFLLPLWQLPSSKAPIQVKSVSLFKQKLHMLCQTIGWDSTLPVWVSVWVSAVSCASARTAQ